jgi:phenylpropionate dioxygenase-like ring-hydroxylating dioxygenase large terminal subunit
MLNEQQNRELTEVAAGTPMGNLLREFWLPVVIQAELTPGGPPLRLRVLDEDLVAFRTPENDVGVVSAYCAHRCAPLWFGRSEEGGIRCTYHGWKYDKDGHCLEMPNEPPRQRFEAKVRLTAYPAAELAGMVWVYLGSQTPRPPLPAFEWAHLPPGQVHVSRWLHESNWVQGLEGEVDNSHVPFLHQALDSSDNSQLLDGERTSVFQIRESTFAVRHPQLVVRNTSSGLLIGSRRDLGDDGFHWRVTRWWPPSWVMIGNPTPPFNGRGYVPIDDNHTMVFSYTYHPDRPLDEDELRYVNSGLGFPPSTVAGPYTLLDGYVVDIPVPVENVSNDYLVNRVAQAAGTSFTGIRGMNPQDRSVQDAMRPVARGKRIVDRSREKLGTADVGIIASRRALLKMAKTFRTDGSRPLVVTDGTAYRGRSLDVVTSEGDFDGLIDAYAGFIGETTGKAALQAGGSGTN